MSIKTKTTLAIVTPVAVSIALFAMFAERSVRSAIINETVLELEAVADLRVAEIGEIVEGYRANARGLADQAAAGPLAAVLGAESDSVATAVLRSVLASYDRLNPEIASIALFSPVGRVLATSAPDQPRPEPRLMSPMPLDMTGPNAADGVMMSVVRLDGGSTQLYVRAPVSATAGPGYHLEVHFDALRLRSAIQGAAFGETGEILLASRDADGGSRFLAPARGLPDATGRRLAGPGDRLVPMTRALEGADVVLTDGAIDHQGVPVVAVTRYLPDFDWGLVAKRDVADVLGSMGVFRSLLTLFAGGLLTGALVVSQILGGRLFETARRLESELAARTLAEQRYRQIVETSPTAILELDERGRIVLANEQAARLLGYPAETLATMTVRDVVPPEDRRNLTRLRREFESATDLPVVPPGRDFVALHRSGRRIPVEVRLTPSDTGEGPGVLATLVDLTEREEAARVLEERADALARSNGELDSFAYAASHDLKAPLRGIDQLAGFIEEDAGSLLPEPSRHDLALLRSRVRRMSGMLDGLLEYSRIGRQESEPQRVELEPMVREMADLYLPAPAFSLEITTPLPHVYAPPVAVEMVVRNLLMNAVKHHDRGSGVVRLFGYLAGGSAHVFVADDGPGIDARYRDRVFALFETLRSRDELEGGGLGLSIARKAIEAHGGSIDIAHTEGRGTTFHLRWPTSAGVGEGRPAA